MHILPVMQIIIVPILSGERIWIGAIMDERRPGLTDGRFIETQWFLSIVVSHTIAWRSLSRHTVQKRWIVRRKVLPRCPAAVPKLIDGWGKMRRFWKRREWHRKSGRFSGRIGGPRATIKHCLSFWRSARRQGLTTVNTTYDIFCLLGDLLV